MVYITEVYARKFTGGGNNKDGGRFSDGAVTGKGEDAATVVVFEKVKTFYSGTRGDTKVGSGFFSSVRLLFCYMLW